MVLALYMVDPYGPLSPSRIGPEHLQMWPHTKNENIIYSIVFLDIDYRGIFCFVLLICFLWGPTSDGAQALLLTLLRDDSW